MERRYQPHPLALKMPPMLVEEYRELCDDIAKNGLLDPITLFEDQVLDGVHRYRACQLVGKEPHYKVYLGDDPFGFVWSKNGQRRHLSVKQRRELAKEYVQQHPDKSDRALAEKTGVTDKTVAAIRTEIAEKEEEVTAEIDRIEGTLKKDGTPRRARGRKPGQKATEQKEAKPKPLTNPRDRWVALSAEVFSAHVGDATHAIVMIARDHSDQIRAMISEQSRRVLVEQFAEALGLKLTDA